jgi:hypothetical protein
MGEDLSALSLKDLHHLEQLLEMSLHRVREKKVVKPLLIYHTASTFFSPITISNIVQIVGNFLFHMKLIPHTAFFFFISG